MQVIRRIGLEQTILEASDVLGDHEVSALQNGGYVITWYDRNSVTKAQVFGPNGQPKTEAFNVSNSANDQNRPAVATLADGSFVVTFTLLHPGTETSINAQRFSADGERIGDEFEAYWSSSHTSIAPDITALADGGYVIAYTGFGRDGSYFSYHARVFDADGTPRGSDFRVNQTTESYQSFGDVISLEDGGFAVTWRSREVDGSFYAVMLRIYDHNGSPRTNELQINQYWNDSQINPTIARLENGNILLAWESEGQDGSSDGVYARIVAPDGTPIGDEFQVNTRTEDHQFMPEVTALSDGGFLVVWTDITSEDTWVIKAQRYSATGERLGDETTLSQESGELKARPEVIELSDGVISVSWQDYTRETISGQIETRLFLTPDLGTDGDDVLSGTRFRDRLEAQRGDDKLLGYAGNDRLIGGLGHDTIKGHSGTDRLFGSSGQDRLLGNGGQDTLNGGAGNDRLVGGSGADTFVFSSGRDVISDFDTSNNGERIDLSAVDSISNFRDLMDNHVSEENGDLVISDGRGNTLTLAGIELTDLDQGDFIF